MVAWMPGLVLLGTLADPCALSCAPFRSRQQTPTVSLLVSFPLEEAQLFIETDSSFHETDEEVRLRAPALGGTGWPRVDERECRTQSHIASPASARVRLLVFRQRPDGVSLIYVFCSLRI
jgi:hypothetical protein